MRLCLEIQFDGAAYAGWLIQPNRLAVQEVLQKALSQGLGQEVELMGCSRTDAGVHAHQYFVHFDLDTCAVPLDKLPWAINRLLPDDVVVLRAMEVDAQFHVVKDCLQKTYRYTLWRKKIRNPFVRQSAWHMSFDMNRDWLEKAVGLLQGEQDYRSFCTEPERKKHHVRHVYQFDADLRDDFCFFTISANGFLYNMVRIMVGTAVDVARGKIALERLPQIIAARDRTEAGVTAPAQGLSLIGVKYAAFE